MRAVITTLGGVFLLLALCVVVMNWCCAIASLRNKRKGIERHYSTVPIVSILLAFCAMFMCPYFPGAWSMLIPAVDIANLNLLFAPVYLIAHARRRQHDHSSSTCFQRRGERENPLPGGDDTGEGGR